MSARMRIFRRAVVGFISLCFGAAVSAVFSPEFREFLGDSDFAVIAYAVIPSLVLAADKAWRERTAKA